MDPKKRRPKLLLVDDEADFLRACSIALSHRGFEVTSVVDARAALEAVAQDQYDIAIVDVKMPGMNGEELFDRLSKMEPELVVILLTGHGSLQQAFETSRRGVYDYLSKPIDMNYLAELSHRAVMKRQQRLHPANREAPQEQLGSPRVLVVDDDIELLAALVPALERRGLEVISACSGSAALAEIKQGVIDVVVLDLVLPGMNGLEILKRIKTADPRVEVIILTGNPNISAAMKVLRDGAFDFVVKPHDVDELVNCIRCAYEKKKEQEREDLEELFNDLVSKYPT